MTDPIDLSKEVQEKDQEIDGTTADIGYLIEEIINRTGIINDLKISLPRSCLKDVCNVLEKREFPEMRCQINVYRSFILLHFFNRPYPQRRCHDD